MVFLGIDLEPPLAGIKVRKLFNTSKFILALNKTNKYLDIRLINISLKL